MNEANTCGDCELSERATAKGMTAFLWCSINVQGKMSGFSKLAHYLSPQHSACGCHVPRVTPLAPEPVFEDVSPISQETLDQELGTDLLNSGEEALLPDDPRVAAPVNDVKRVSVGLDDQLFKEFFL